MNKESSESIDRQLEDWRKRGHDQLAPLRFHFIEALSRRASHQNGAARRWLNERLSTQLQAYQDEVVEPAQQTEQQRSETQTDPVTAGPLAELLAYTASLTPESHSASPVSSKIVQHGSLSLDSALIDYFREAWARVSANGLLRQSRAQVPDNAGPLNSSSLAHRALIVMREQSPGYLHHFLSYIDALSWMEQLNDERKRASAKPAVAGKRKVAKRQA
ncbi:DUF2894 domain-containing protein [Pollutimonas harenae]|uniref:DUF2894 domain-containing protein n=1 Tax=Pollutimonas harenae TaxID=657015 RepID=A0A853GUD5_9BURK|nr:DUF2894 domain-containing protein [Pollutimonas harenae]NYT86788.1 DUF2894 domain-containing protein [Pollutimonas harenae]TEA71435.1 DUF2894 domain-containing protein [Pollutimonas harenae]